MNERVLSMLCMKLFTNTGTIHPSRMVNMKEFSGMSSTVT
jgi:hypothetical protein